MNSDIAIAQRIVSGADPNILVADNFNSRTGIYMTSNERIDKYHKYLMDRKRILSVIASGEQILNCILEGTKSIDAFDISRFPKYLLQLKIAGIKALSLNEYLEFFYCTSRKEERNEDLYDRIRIYLDDANVSFWDGLMDFFSWYEITNSSLFIGEPVIKGNVISRNKYLQSEESYKKLRKVIDSVDIRTYDGNILDINNKFEDKYDLVYLSNIIYYIFIFFSDFMWRE